MIPRAEPQVHFLSFFTEGPPFDKGSNLSLAARNFQKLVEPEFETTTFETPQTLLAQDPTWSHFFRDRTAEIISHPAYNEKVRWKAEWAATGLFEWKPRLVLQHLLREHIRPNDIVFYHDANVSKYPEYLQGIHRWRNWTIREADGCDLIVFQDNRAKLTSDAKPDLIEKFFPLTVADSLYHIWAGALIVRKTANSVKFLEEWLRLCSEPENLNPVSAGMETTNFSLHAPEQAILGCLWHSASRAKAIVTRKIYLRDSRQIPPRAWTIAERKRQIVRVLRKAFSKLLLDRGVSAK